MKGNFLFFVLAVVWAFGAIGGVLCLALTGYWPIALGVAAGWLMDNGVKFDQCIDEQVGGERWLHLAVRDNNGRQRCQNLLIKV